MQKECVDDMIRNAILLIVAALALKASSGAVLESQIVGEVSVEGLTAGWTAETTRQSLGSGLEQVTVRISSDRPRTPPRFRVSFSYPLRDCVGQWRTGAAFGKYITQDWRGEARWSSSLASQAPVVAFYNSASMNRLAVACSESLRKVEFRTGICERKHGSISYAAEFFTLPEAPLEAYEASFLVDVRDVFYADAVRNAFDWCVRKLGHDPHASVEPAAFDPLYSTWYSYQQDVNAAVVERECAESVKYGLKTVIVDDGWQTDNGCGGYSYCGDWMPSTNRFPDFAAHVEKVHRMGLRYMLWYSVPFVGENSKSFTRFKGKYLYHNAALGASVLDPRFPEVRAFLVGIYVRAAEEWKLDGFKLDFIDEFVFRGADPAVAENYSGRDIKALPEAVDRLMQDIVGSLKAINPNVLLEFRQSYVGPAIRGYGNMMRVGDCAYGVAQNRTGSLDLRLSSGTLAVHSDMIIWNGDEPPETAALQFLNILFCVPQISVRLDGLSAAHREMLRRWLDFWSVHRETLMFGELRPMRPDLNYSVVYAYGKGEQVIAVYDADQVVRVDSAKGTAYIVNATPAASLLVERDGLPRRILVAPSSVAVVECNQRPFLSAE